MCGIVAYVGQGQCKKVILDGLARLEYRGYDSAGFVCIDDKHKHFSFVKKIGMVDELKKALDKKPFDGRQSIRWKLHHKRGSWTFK